MSGATENQHCSLTSNITITSEITWNVEAHILQICVNGRKIGETDNDEYRGYLARRFDCFLKDT